MEIPCIWQKTFFVFLFFYLCRDDATVFGPLPKLKNTRVSSSRISVPKKDVWVPQFEMAWPKISERSFFGDLTRDAGPKFFCISLFGFVSAKRHGNPENVAFGMRRTLVARSTWDFSKAKRDSHKSWKINSTFFVRYPKNIIAGFSVEPFEARPRRPSSGMKIPEDCTDFFECSQQPTVSSINIVTLGKKWKNEVVSAVRERFPSAMSGTKALNRPYHLLQPTSRKFHTSNRKSVKISPCMITMSRFLRWNYKVNNWLRHFAPRTRIFQSRDRGRISTISKMTEYNNTILLTSGLIQSPPQIYTSGHGHTEVSEQRHVEVTVYEWSCVLSYATLLRKLNSQTQISMLRWDLKPAQKISPS